MIFRSPRPDFEVPDLPLTDFLIESAGRWGDKPAFVDAPTARTLTFAQWIEATRATAAALAARGMRKGDVLALFSPNLPEYAVAFHGAALAGGTVTTANPLYTAHELGGQLRDCAAKFLITAPAFLATAREAADGTAVREIFVFGEADGATPFSALQTDHASPPVVSIDPREDVVALPYSSGTTGLPKGVMLTHRNLVANVEQSRALAVTAEDTLLGLLPFFHSYGMLCLMNGGLRNGTTVVTLPRFEPELFLDTLARYRVTFAHLVPPMILLLAKHPHVERFDLSALQTICSGAAPLGAEVARACGERVGCTVLQGYGLTETSPVTHVATPEIAREDPGSIGCSVANTETKVVEQATGRVLPPGESGEIHVRGPQVMKGYLGQPQATADMIDPDGWLRTGDVGYAGDDGRLFVVDRVKELIKYKGCQVAPAELEALLLTHEAVADAAVIGVPDEQAGELPKAFCVLRRPIEADAIVRWVAGRVAPFKKIRLVEVVDEIPKSPSGKILRRLLADRERERMTRGDHDGTR